MSNDSNEVIHVNPGEPLFPGTYSTTESQLEWQKQPLQRPTISGQRKA